MKSIHTSEGAPSPPISSDRFQVDEARENPVRYHIRFLIELDFFCQLVRLEPVTAQVGKQKRPNHSRDAFKEYIANDSPRGFGGFGMCTPHRRKIVKESQTNGQRGNRGVEPHPQARCFACLSLSRDHWGESRVGVSHTGLVNPVAISTFVVDDRFSLLG